jgi:DNA repair exonuclease SbcCD ATPase subunit
MKLKKLEVTAFAGIDPQSAVVIDFSNSKFVVSEGDNGVGKTSLLNALLVACGQLSHTGKEGKNFINQDSDKIDIKFDFVGKDRCNYSVACTKSQFKLTYDGNLVSEPITKMKELLGVVGVSPMEIKNAKVSEIVKWLASYTNKSAEDFEREMKKIKDSIKLAKDSRAAANKSLKSLNEYLENEPMAQNWEESEKKYAVEPDIKKLSAELKAAGDKSDKYLLAEERLKQHNSTRETIQSDIDRLRKELEEKEKKMEETDGLIVAAQKYLEDHKADKKNYDEVKKRYDNVALELADYNKWQEIKRKKAERDEFETLSQKADAKEKELSKKVTELHSEILPDIKGVELVTEDTYEDGKVKKEGLYWNGKNTAQLSESEFWALVMSIWRKYKVKVVVIDNFQSLGSMAVEILEKLVKDGAYVLAAEMHRETKELTINYR